MVLRRIRALEAFVKRDRRRVRVTLSPVAVYGDPPVERTASPRERELAAASVVAKRLEFRDLVGSLRCDR